MKTVKLALIGYGGAAKAFTKLLITQADQLRAMGFNVCITVVATHSRGSIYNPEGLNPTALLNRIEHHGHFREHGHFVDLSTLEMIAQLDYDVLVELSTLNIFTGEPAISHIKTAFSRNKHVITANKGPIAWAYNPLKAIADEKQLAFLYETTVMDGTPVFNLVKDTLPMCQVIEIRGILNTTTNFILGHLEAGEAIEDIMAEGRRRGFVEADPSLDVDGWDAAAKLTALMNVLMDAGIKPTDVQRIGIKDIGAEELLAAKAQGKTIKLLCRGYIQDGSVFAEVSPQLVDKGALYAGIDETSSVVSIVTDLMGTISVVEHNPEIEQTGYGILSDLVRLLKWIDKKEV